MADQGSAYHFFFLGLVIFGRRPIGRVAAPMNRIPIGHSAASQVQDEASNQNIIRLGLDDPDGSFHREIEEIVLKVVRRSFRTADPSGSGWFNWWPSECAVTR